MWYFYIALAVVALIALPTIWVGRRLLRRRQEQRHRLWLKMQSDEPVEDEETEVPKLGFRLRLPGLPFGLFGSPMTLRMTKEWREAIAAIPSQIDALIPLHAAYRERAQALSDAYDSCTQAVSELIKINDLTDERMADIDQWWQQLVNANLSVRRKTRLFTAAQAEFYKARDELLKFKTPLDTIDSQLKLYRLDSLTAAQLESVDILSQLLFEMGKVTHTPNCCGSFAPLALEPATPDGETEELCHQLASLVQEQVVYVRELKQKMALAEGARTALEEFVRSEIALPEPKRPVESEVTAFIDAAVAWAGKRQALAWDLATKSVAMETLTYCDPASEALRSRCAEIDDRLSRLLPAYNPQRCFTPEEMQSKNKKIRAKIANAPPEVSPISDQARSEYDAASHVFDACTDVRYSAPDEIEEFEGKRGGELYDLALRDDGESVFRQPLSEEQSARCATIRGAMRKLGFALAQKHMSQAKVTEAEKAAESQPVAAQEPMPDLPSVDAYLHVFKRWGDAIDAEYTRSWQAQERLRELRTQSGKRLDQSVEAARALQRCVGGLETSPEVPAQLDVMLRTALMVAARYGA